MPANAINSSVVSKIQKQYPQISLKSAQALATLRAGTLANAREFDGILAAHLSLGVTTEHINMMVATGMLDERNIYVGKAINGAFESSKVPQIFGRPMRDIAELITMITDPVTLESCIAEFKRSGTLPTFYLMNALARVAHATMLGGKLADFEQLQKYWNGIPGDTVSQKIITSGIPLLGCSYKYVHG